MSNTRIRTKRTVRSQHLEIQKCKQKGFELYDYPSEIGVALMVRWGKAKTSFLSVLPGGHTIPGWIVR